MKRKQLTILLIAGVVIGAIAWWTQSQRSEAWQVGTAEEREKVFPDFAPDQVAQIGIREGDREVHLELREGRWTVREREQYPADFSQIKDLIRAIWELEPVRQIQVGPDHLGRLNLSDPEQAGSSGTQVAFRDQEGETVQTVILGKEETRERSGGPQSQFGRGGGIDARGTLCEGLGRGKPGLAGRGNLQLGDTRPVPLA